MSCPVPPVLPVWLLSSELISQAGPGCGAGPGGNGVDVARPPPPVGKREEDCFKGVGITDDASLLLLSTTSE